MNRDPIVGPTTLADLRRWLATEASRITVPSDDLPVIRSAPICAPIAEISPTSAHFRRPPERTGELRESVASRGRQKRGR